MTETKRCSSDWLFQPYLVFDVGDGSERRDNEYVLFLRSPVMGPELLYMICGHIYIQKHFAL